jgi:hypothetical protein
MLEAYPGLRPVAVLEEMQRCHPDHDWDRLCRSLERRVRAWRPTLAKVPPAQQVECQRRANTAPIGR